MPAKYKQLHPETCLARSLLILVDINGIKIKDKDELNIFMYALKHNRENFAVGHIKRFTEKFNVSLNWYCDTKIYYDFMKKQKLPKKADLKLNKIDLKFLDSLIENKPVAIYVDRFYLWKKGQDTYYRYHWPHFVVVLNKTKQGYVIIDPDDGEKHIIDKKRFYKGIVDLKKRLWFCPQLIQIK